MAANGGMSARRRKMFVLRDDVGITQAELLELAELIVYRDIESTNDLDEREVELMLAAFEGWRAINHLLSHR